MQTVEENKKNNDQAGEDQNRILNLSNRIKELLHGSFRKISLSKYLRGTQEEEGSEVLKEERSEVLKEERSEVLKEERTGALKEERTGSPEKERSGILKEAWRGFRKKPSGKGKKYYMLLELFRKGGEEGKVRDGGIFRKLLPRQSDSSRRFHRASRRRRVQLDGRALVLLSGVVLAIAAFSLSPEDRQNAPESFASPRTTETGASEGSVTGTAAVRSPEEYREVFLSLQNPAAGRFFCAADFMEAVSSARRKIVEQKSSLERELENQYNALLESGKASEFIPSSESEKALWEKVRKERRDRLSEDPLLILVNRRHYLPEGYQMEPVSLENGQMIGKVCYEPLEQMLGDCRKAGGTPLVCSGYRLHWYQENLFEAQINRWLYEGYDEEEAKALAATAVAVPGTSEHELGLAADIYSSENTNLDESQVGTFTQQWLMENSWRYGFILRYPQNKSSITGIIFEPWHYRYVGTENAKKIYDSGLCLEEYLDRVEDM